MIAIAFLLSAAAQAGPADLSHPVSLQPINLQQQEGTIADVWQPAATPRGGVSWRLLESTRETTRKAEDGYIRSRPLFPPGVKALNGRRIKVAGFMMPLENASRQRHFVLLAYPPGCPFHTHAMPNQFIEVKADIAFPVEIEQAIVVEGVLELTGQDESGIFYRLNASRPG